MNLKIGVLVPSSNFITLAGKEYISGIKAGFAQAELPEPEIFLELAGFNAEVKVVVDKTQKLLLQHDVDLIMGVLGFGLIESVKKLCEEYKVPFLVNNIGGNTTLPVNKSPYIFTNSLNYWASQWTAGYWCAQNRGKTCGCIVSFHEAGYDLFQSFTKGFQAGGGELPWPKFAHQDSRTQDATSLFAELEEQKVDFIYCLAAGKEAVSLLTNYVEWENNSAIPVVGGGIFTDEHWLTEMGEGANGITTFLSWSANNTSAGNSRFKEEMDKLGYNANSVFALLSYESAALITEVLKAHDGTVGSGEEWVKGLKEVQFDGPRDTISFSGEHQEVLTKDLLREVQLDPDTSTYVNQSIETLDRNPELITAYDQSKLEKNIGWDNPYLCG